MKKMNFLFSVLLLAFILITSCDSDDSTETQSDNTQFTDPRDNQVYSVVEIGQQFWMVKNLNYETGNSWCMVDNISNCDTHGRLYDWQTALTACPDGWHLPTDSEWTILANNLGGASLAGGKLKSTTAWELSCSHTTNSSGFTAIPGGYRTGNGYYSNFSEEGNWWSSTEYNNTLSWRRELQTINCAENDILFRTTFPKIYGLSCRCIKN
jgi:uncharacterized protein (TIGR02145 family)